MINNSPKVALVFGISGDQGQAVAKGLLATKSYRHVYGVTRDLSEGHVRSIGENMGSVVKAMDPKDAVTVTDDANWSNNNAAHEQHVTLLHADLNNPSSIQSVLCTTRATDIFLVTTTDMPPEEGAMGSFHDCEEREFESIVGFFDVLVDLHKKEWSSDHNNDHIGDGVGTKIENNEKKKCKKLERHVIFSTYDNVRGLVEWLELHKDRDIGGLLPNMKPLDDGGIVPHYSGKGRGGDHALSLIHGVPNPWKTDSDTPWKSSTTTTAVPTIIPGLTLTLITLPFLHSNFSKSTIPLPTTTEGRTIEWSISACLGDSSHPLDMFSLSDLQYIIPTLFSHKSHYQGRKIRLSAEKITMDEISFQFSDLFGKDVIYSPLTLEEMSAMEFPGAPALAQMCMYLVSLYAECDVEETERIMELYNNESIGKNGGGIRKKPQTFQDWLLTHSDDAAFEKVGLSLDANPITTVAVFNANSMQGESVIKGLLSDTRKQYTIRACIPTNIIKENEDSTTNLEEEAKRIASLDPERITTHFVNIDDIPSCTNAVQGADGAFLVTNFYKPLVSSNSSREASEERHARNVIDACSASDTIRHIVLSTLESAEDVDNELKNVEAHASFSSLGGVDGTANGGDEEETVVLDVKARMAAYARSKKISITYVLMPVYSEQFFLAMAETIRLKRGDVSEGVDESATDEEIGHANDNGLDGSGNDERVVCVSVDELGPAVANILDSYEVYAGHEIALVTDVLSMSEATGIIENIFFETKQEIRLESSGSSSSANSSASLTMLAQSQGKVVDTFAKDLGSIFREYSKTELVKQRHLVAKTMELVPDAKPFRRWLEENRDNVEFREMLGLR